MAESTRNEVIHGFKGKFGDLLVFRQRAGKTIASRRPEASDAPPSQKQSAIREQFQRAVIYGRGVLANPASKEQYEAAAEGGKSAYNIAIADFFQAPDIVEIDVTGYTGQAGQPIKVKVTDDFKVKEVFVAIRDQDGSVLEEGNAVQVGDSAEWVFTSSSANPDLKGDRIEVTATDLPANMTKNEKTL